MPNGIHGEPTAFSGRSLEGQLRGFLLSYMAHAWFEPFIFTDEPPPFLDNWTLFEREITNMFGDPDEVATAERAIRRLRMRENHTVARYITDFRRYANTLRWNDEALFSQFREGLPDHILDQLVQREDQPITLTDLQNLVLRYDTRYWERQRERDGRRRTVPDRPSESTRPVRRSTPGTPTRTPQRTSTTRTPTRTFAPSSTSAAAQPSLTHDKHGSSYPRRRSDVFRRDVAYTVARKDTLRTSVRNFRRMGVAKGRIRGKAMGNLEIRRTRTN
jgi:hypothetical protein